MVTVAAAPKGPMTHAFTYGEIFSPPQGKDTGLEVQILVKTGTLSYEVEILGFRAGIWALRLKFRLPGWDLGLGIRYWAWD